MRAGAFIRFNMVSIFQGGYSETCEVLLNYEPKLFQPMIELVKEDHIKEAMVRP